VNLVPYALSSGTTTDGWKILDTLRGTNERVFDVISTIMGEIAAGVRPRDWAPAMIQALNEVQSSELKFWTAQVFLHYYSIDRDDTAGARAHLDAALNARPSMPSLRAEAAFFAAWFGNDAVRALELLKDTSQARVDPEALTRAGAAIAFRQGKFAEALL